MDWMHLLPAIDARLKAKVEPRTAYTYWRAILICDFKDKPSVEALTSKTIEWRQASLSNATILHRYAAVKWILKNFPREFDPLDVQEMFTFMEGVKRDEKEMVFATREEAEKIIARAPIREALAIGMAYFGGLRLGEIVNAKLSHFQFDKSTGRMSLLVPSEPSARTKNGRERRIPVLPQLESLFNEYVKGERARLIKQSGVVTDALLLTRKGHVAGISWRRLQDAIVRACKACGLGHLHPHSFRHGLATILARETHDVKLVQSVLGHKNVRSTMLYIHMSQKEIAHSMQSAFL